jgi:hypothetical protein
MDALVHICIYSCLRASGYSIHEPIEMYFCFPLEFVCVPGYGGSVWSMEKTLTMSISMTSAPGCASQVREYILVLTLYVE